MKQPELEVADVFRKNISSLKKLTKTQWKAVNALINCRTAQLGGHVSNCNNCDFKEQSYNSCGNRHCPKCGALAKEKWLNKRMEELLPVQYFHVVFTIPHELNELFMYNKKKLYSQLLKCVKNVIVDAAEDESNIGATPGFMEILHTWGQNLEYHPHVHCIVPGGGLKNNKWKSCKNNYFITVKKLSRMFRGSFLKELKKSYKKGFLNFPDHLFFENLQEFNDSLTKLYKKEWVVYSKKPFSKPETVLKYLSRYTHRVAISNYRIKKITDKEVSFLWKDYRKNKQKTMTLSVKEFMRRFLLHVLPSGFVKIRNCGLFCNRNKKENLKLCRKLLNLIQNHQQSDGIITENLVLDIWKALIKRNESKKCPACKVGVIEKKSVIPFYKRQRKRE